MHSLILIASSAAQHAEGHVTRFDIVICEDLVFHILERLLCYFRDRTNSGRISFARRRDATMLQQEENCIQ